MDMEKLPTHEIKICDRKVTTITGVKKLDAFNERNFTVETVMGYIDICGYGLGLEGMDMEKGVLVIRGNVDSISYTGKDKKITKESFFKKIFK